MEKSTIIYCRHREAAMSVSSPRYSALPTEQGAPKQRRASSWSWWRRALLLALTLSTLCSLFVWRNTSLLYYMHRRATMLVKNTAENGMEDSDGRFIVLSKNCRVPNLDPWSTEALQFAEPPIRVQCCNPKGLPALISSTYDSLIVNEDARIKYGSDVRCCYRTVHRIDKDHYKMTPKCIDFEWLKVEHEFIYVQCLQNVTVVYENIYMYVIRKRRLDKLCKMRAKAWSPYPKDAPPLSVLIFGLDGASRLNFHRQTPGTLAQLRRLGAEEMLGFGRVGESTLPNMVAALSGLSLHQTHEVCWPTLKSHFDDCPFIWNDFKRAGYKTVYSEDTFGSIFSYCVEGFKNQPTDYYTRHVFRFIYENMEGPPKSGYPLCKDTQLTHEFFYEYIKQFLQTFETDRFFALFWSGVLSHHDMNYMKFSDIHYEKLLRGLQKSKGINRTAIIMMADHGPRMGYYTLTHQGHLESLLPGLFIALPQWFRAKYPRATANLHVNTRRLTSHYDVYATLQDLLHHPTQLPDEKVLEREKKPRISSYSFSPGISLFLPIPDSRTCSEAGIPTYLCPCKQFVDLDARHPIFNRSALFLMNYINKIIRDHPICYTFTSIIKAKVKKQMYSKPLPTLTYVPSVLLIAIEVYPGGGQFETTLEYNNYQSLFTLASPIRRVDEYFKTSLCTSYQALKPLCYCKNNTFT